MGDAIVRILALHPDVEITSRNESPFGVLVTGGSRMCALDRNEQAALWHACGASPRGTDLPGAAPELVDGLAQRLMGEGLVDVTEREQTTPARDAHFSLARDLDLRPAFYEIVDANEDTIHLISELGATLFDSCDGRRTVPELHALAQDKGHYVDAADVAKQVTMLQSSGLVSRGFAPRRDTGLKVRLKAVVARRPGDYGYLISADEAELLQRFQTGRSTQDLLAMQPAQDRPWIASCLAKAATLGILEPASADFIESLADEFEQENPTEITYADDFNDAPATPAPAPSAAQAGWRKAAARGRSQSMPATRPTPTPAAGVGRATPAAGVGVIGVRPSSPPAMPPSRATPMPRAATTAGFGAPMVQQVAPPAPVMPSMMHEEPVHAPPPVRPSSNFVAQGTPTHAPAMPIAPAPAPAPRPSAPMDGAAQARLASLQGLSLNKGADNTPVTTYRRQSGGSKLPWILLLLVVGAGGYYIYSMKKQAPAPVVADPGSGGSGSNKGSSVAPPPAPAGAVVLTASAYVAAKAPITLSTTAGGRLLELKVDNGDKVTKGQLLAKLDDAAIRAQQRIASAEVGSAVANLKTVKKLFAVQAKTSADVQAAESAVSVASARASQYTQQLEEMRIKAPRDATVIERKVQAGETLTPNQPVLVIADLSELVAEADVNESDLKLIRPAMDVDISLDANANEPFKGKVLQILPSIDKARGTGVVRIDIVQDPARPMALRPGVSVTVRFKTPPAPEEATGSAGSASADGSAAAGSGSTGTGAAK